MANKSLFSSMKALLPRATARNDAGGPAFALGPKNALAQFAATGCFNGTFYADAESQLDTLKTLIAQVNDNVFLAKLAVYSRERAFLKDMPAALAATLAARDTVLFHQVFDRVVDNGRVLRTLFQMIRSGQFGKKSLSSSLQRAFQRWLNAASPEKLLSASIGHDPSLRDILRMARPTPADNARRALFGWLTDKEVAKWTPAGEVDLPEQVRLLVAFRTAETAEQQIALLEKLHARWDLLADTAKGVKVWAAIARTMGPQALRMNLNTLQRHGVFDDWETVKAVAARLTDETDIRRSRQFPYQFFAAYLNAADEVPQAIKTALHKAAEIACGNVPELPGPVVIGLDVSGSMQSPVTGHRGRGSTTKMRCVDVAALVAAALLRRNPDSVVVPFDTQAFEAKVDPSDSILSLADRLAKYGGGGTDCSMPIKQANAAFAKRKFAGVVLVSDNESWVYQGRPYFYGANGSTGVMTEWQHFVRNQVRLQGGDITGPKLICIDLQPNQTTQAPERSDILNVGGFSDAVFEVMSAFLTVVKLKTGKGYVWVFATLEDVVFLYRPTREGDFLKKLLKDFKGVLVSDFYAAYDAIDCPQQKCLIHLMRDMNQELLNNPFDEELQSVTEPFGVLLREVVTTIDQHGLKRCHLKAHVRGVAQFFESLAGQSFHSEAAVALRHRLLKNRDKLFTFIEHDGVPWNNNNAENAIKRFAYYREGTIGIMKEAGLSDYLVLLSLCHTCRHRGISFLKFLLSRERNIDVLGRRRRARRRPAIEVYPKGYMPPHVARLRKKKGQTSGVGDDELSQQNS